MDKGTPQTHPSDEWVAFERLTENIALRNRISELEAEVVRKDAALLESQQMMLDEQEKRQAAEAEVARLREVIWRNADPFDASDEDAEIIEEIARGITP